MATIALDFSSLDKLTFANGQYRYVIDLIAGLSRIPDYRYIVLGSQSEQPADIQKLVDGNHRWSYQCIPHATYRGGYFVDHLKFALSLHRWRTSVFHALHTFIPRLCKCPVVVTEHDLMFDLFDEYSAVRRTRQYRWYRRSVSRATRIIAISRTTANDLTRLHGIEPGHIDVVYHGSRFAVPIEAHVGRVRSQTVLSPYNLEPRKNIRVLLQSIALLKDRFPELRLVLFGRAAWTEERERQFECWLDECQIRDRVTRLGFVDDSTLKTLYRECTLFVFPSLYEGFGLPILEAMAMGACVIARNASSMAEVVGSAGFLIETASNEEMSKCLGYALDNPEECTKLRREAKIRSQLFTVDRMARETVAAYEKALEGRATKRSVSLAAGAFAEPK